MKLLVLTAYCLLLLTTIHAFSPVMRYNEAVQQIWHNDEQQEVSMKDLVRCATLAPSSHNTQCWKFVIPTDRSITILPDLTRTCPTVDPDDHHLFASLGCAVENLVVAGLAHGLEAEVDASDPAEGIEVRFTPCPPQVTPQYQAIPDRRVTRAVYNGEKLSEQEMDQLKKATIGGNGVHVLFLTDGDSLTLAQQHIVDANTVQMQDADFRKELKEWIRFSEQECVNHGDGLAGPTTGKPFVPRWIGSHILDFSLKAHPENVKIEKQIASSAGIAVFWSDKDDASHWVEAGRLYQRFALTATSLGIRNAFLNQPVEVAEARPKFAEALGIKEGRPDLIVRFGRGGTELPHSLRRPVEDVIVQ